MPDTSAEWWYEYHREDYAAVRRRLSACRNVMLRGRRASAAEMLRKSCVNAVLSIQTARGRHERAFSMYYAGDRSLETAATETMYGYQKLGWLRDSLASVDFGAIVDDLRDDGPAAAHARLVDDFKGLSWVKAGFALSMVGIWELACPDSRTKDVLGIDGRITTRDDYREALAAIDDALDIDQPTFIKQWVLYDWRDAEHARHMVFYREVLGPTVR